MGEELELKTAVVRFDTIHYVKNRLIVLLNFRETAVMSNAIEPAFNIDDDDPLIRYDIDFRKRTKLFTGSPFSKGSTDTGTVRTGVTEALEDGIEWDPHVDEADKLDYIVAVSSGVLAGLVDTFYVGELSLDHAREWGKSEIEKIVMKVAHLEGYSGNGLSGAIRTLEKNHPFAADGNTNDFGGGIQHHLRDFSHHFSIGGLFFSIFTQFTGQVVGTDKAGALHFVPVRESHRECIGRNFQEKVAFGTIGWFFHMVSDMAGSSGSLMGGTGIPGPIISFMKELSSLPFFKDSGGGDMGFRLWVTKLFNGTLLADRDETGKIIRDSVRRFDLRTEIGILGEVSRQSLPLMINQCVVRGLYFCRRLAREMRNLEINGIGDFARIAPEDVLPWNTQAMRRMVTVSSGVFTGVDIADAAVRAIKSKNPVTFFLRVNYVGVATFVIACMVDVRATLEEKTLAEEENAEAAYERDISELGCLKLDSMQTRILHSLEYALVVHDITVDNHPKRAEKKRVWLKNWSERVAAAVGLIGAADAGYFMDDDSLYDAIGARIEKTGKDSWLWLIAMEAKRFNPYMPLHSDDDKLYKGLKLCSDYLGDVFCKRQMSVGRKELSKLDKSVGRAKDALDGVAAKRIGGGASVVAIGAVTGGLAFYFAPAIAPTLAAVFGFEAAALHGAALTSASLAFLGGGAIAAGGVGMAGGTMFIAGGGALLGAVSGSGFSAAASMALATNGSYVLDECSKLVSFCKEILIGRYGDLISVVEIHAVLNQRIVELEVEIESLKRGTSEDEIPEDDNGAADGKNEISPKKIIKILNRSCKFMRHSSDELEKALKSRRKREPK